MITTLHTNQSAIIRVFNSNQEGDIELFDRLCKDAYEIILIRLPWANVTPSLHKLLAHSAELIHNCNDGHGMKVFSEEGLESCNKLIRRYREPLARKTSFSHNCKDIFLRLLSQSNPLLTSYRKVLSIIM